MKNSVLETVVSMGLPLCFSGNMLMNIVIEWLFPCSEVYRKGVVYGLLACLMLVIIFYVSVNKNNIKKYYLFAFCVWVCGKIVIGYSLFNQNDLLLINSVKDLFLGVIFFFGVLALTFDNIKEKYFQISFFYSMFVAGIAMCYIYYFLIYLGTRAPRNIGAISYMSMGYFFVDYVVVTLVCLFEKSICKRKKLLLMLAGGAICSAIYVSGCKGAIFTVLCGLGIIGLFFINYYRSYSVIVQFCGVCAVSVIITVFCLETFDARDRMRDFTKETVNMMDMLSDYERVEDKYNDMKKSESLHEGDKYELYRGLVKNYYQDNAAILLRHPEFRVSEKYDYIIDYVQESKSLSQDYEEGLITFEEYARYQNYEKLLNHTAIGGRGLFYLRAVNKVIYSPFWGNGLCDYSLTYGTYPHNILLEAWADLGIIGVCFCLLGWISVMAISANFIKIIDNHIITILMVMFVIVFSMVKNLLSGSIYSYNVFLVNLLSIMGLLFMKDAEYM